MTIRINILLHFITVIILAFLLILSNFSQSIGELLPLDKHGRYIWKQEPFRIFFYPEGEHAVSNVDINNNGISDFVEDVAIQLLTARHVFEISGFPDPLLSQRYPGVKYIDVRIFSESKMNNARGLAFDESSSANDPDNPQARSLIIYVLKDINPKKNLTPAHEYFHQIQNGMTYFKNGWYYEGMARWSEDSLGSSEYNKQENSNALLLKLNNENWLSELFSKRYEAADMLWKPLVISLSQDSSSLPVDDPVLSRKYSDGTPVMRDYSFKGTDFMIKILSLLREADKNAFRERGYDKWSEKNQRNPDNNSYIIQKINTLLIKH